MSADNPDLSMRLLLRWRVNIYLTAAEIFHFARTLNLRVRTASCTRHGLRFSRLTAPKIGPVGRTAQKSGCGTMGGERPVMACSYHRNRRPGHAYVHLERAIGRLETKMQMVALGGQKGETLEATNGSHKLSLISACLTLEFVARVRRHAPCARLSRQEATRLNKLSLADRSDVTAASCEPVYVSCTREERTNTVGGEGEL